MLTECNRQLYLKRLPDRAAAAEVLQRHGIAPPNSLLDTLVWEVAIVLLLHEERVTGLLERVAALEAAVEAERLRCAAIALHCAEELDDRAGQAARHILCPDAEYDGACLERLQPGATVRGLRAALVDGMAVEEN